MSILVALTVVNKTNVSNLNEPVNLLQLAWLLLGVLVRLTMYSEKETRVDTI